MRTHKRERQKKKSNNQGKRQPLCRAIRAVGQNPVLRQRPTLYFFLFYFFLTCSFSAAATTDDTIMA